MNPRIKELANRAGYNDQIYEISKEGLDKFAELIVQECQIALNPMLRDMISRGQAFQLIKDHFNSK